MKKWFGLLMVASFLLISCEGDPKYQDCYAKYKACVEVCDAEMKKAVQDNNDCRAACSKAYSANLAACDAKFPKKGPEWVQCVQEALSNKDACDLECSTALGAAMEKSIACRQACGAEFEKCMTTP
jgi:hypothetical protein